MSEQSKREVSIERFRLVGAMGTAMVEDFRRRMSKVAAEINKANRPT